MLGALTMGARAGEIVGLPPVSPPGAPRVAEISVGNDFFGRGGYIDDYRTQQLALILPIGERWIAALDHSILTLEEPDNASPGRLDQIGGSVGFVVWRDADPARPASLTAGLGFRSAGEFGGSRIQNGFHRLVNSDIKLTPFVGTERTDGSLWVRGEVAAPTAFGSPAWAGQGWTAGYWLHGTALATSDGQWDGAGAAHVTLTGPRSMTWFGLRGDFRGGYSRDIVQDGVADNEEGLYAVFGLRIGPLLLETAQGFDSERAFGRVSLRADLPADAVPPALTDGRYELGVALTAPDILLAVQGRREVCDWFRCAPGRRWRLVADLRFGEPQDGKAVDRYIETLQLGGGLELELRPAGLPRGWAVYGMLGAGWRQERLDGDGPLGAERSGTASGGTLIGETGLRLATSGYGEAWAFRLQLGLSGWLPFSAERVEFAGRSERLLEAGVAAVLGAAFAF
jgi:hypothetical protein